MKLSNTEKNIIEYYSRRKDQNKSGLSLENSFSIQIDQEGLKKAFNGFNSFSEIESFLIKFYKAGFRFLAFDPFSYSFGYTHKPKFNQENNVFSISRGRSLRLYPNPGAEFLKPYKELKPGLCIEVEKLIIKENNLLNLKKGIKGE